MGSFVDSIGLALWNFTGNAVKNTRLGRLICTTLNIYINKNIYREEYFNTVVFKASDRCW